MQSMHGWHPGTHSGTAGHQGLDWTPSHRLASDSDRAWHGVAEPDIVSLACGLRLWPPVVLL